MLLQSKLREWREEQARREGIESYKILSKATLDALVEARPESKEEILLIKGIKEKKYQKYGKAILAIIESVKESSVEKVDSELEEQYEETSHNPLTVSQFLDSLNMELSGMAARITGEVTSVDVRERVVYFTLKDMFDGSMLPCLIFRFAYQISGVEIQIGDQIVVEGAPEIYKPNGRLSLKVGLIELAGEGMLKKAYDELYRKLQEEGLMSEESKTDLPKYPERIALVTSAQGAAIDDFKMNLGNFGLKIDFYPTAVEGKKAVFEILKALKYFRAQADRYDVLVMVRGGGSLESLQAFNNEALVKEVASFPIPTLLGVGHEKDITLAALVADKMVSTPTATAKELTTQWTEGRQAIKNLSLKLPRIFEQILYQKKQFLNTGTSVLLEVLRLIQRKNLRIEQAFFVQIRRFEEEINRKKKENSLRREVLKSGFIEVFNRAKRSILVYEEQLKIYDPRRVLQLGYGLVKKGTALIKDASKIVPGDILSVQLGKGGFEALVKKINK
ncbi:MAG: exodeoxyribonuclease VII large subunit [Candidatus Moranbacteria bacterium]|nr:exodeoxyribonuclease VII large subunit [Candidatus Moranbacteria bacterium]